MSSQVNPDDTVTVESDGVTVEKSFAADEFPVPAIRFHVASEREESVTVRIHEDIPSDFPMDGVGFHPDYESENWTAFQDHHVEYERELDPAEEVVTVYGIRIESQSDVPQFLTEPTVIEVDGDGETAASEATDGDVDAIVDEDSNQVVKDMLSGESNSVPGLESDESDGEADEDAPAVDLDLGSGETDIDADTAESDATAESDGAAEDAASDDVVAAPGVGDDSTETAADDTPEIELDIDEPDTTGEAAADDDGSDASEAPGADPESVTEPEPGDASESVEETRATESADAVEVDVESLDSEVIASELATALRNDDVSEDDLETLRDAFTPDDAATAAGEADSGPAGSGELVAKVEHLQSRVEELAAYTSALEEFLDDEGTAQQLLEDYEAEVADLTETVDGVQTRVEDNATSIDRIDDDVDAVESKVDDLGDDVDAVQDTVTSVESSQDDLESTVETVDTRIDDVERSVAEVESTLDDQVERFSDRMTDVESDLTDHDDELSELTANLEAVEEDVADIKEWRDQLGEMFTD
jgi:prefoldin subunit 5